MGITTHSPERELDLSIKGMTCAACAVRIEKALRKIDGVEATVNLATERAHVRIAADTTDASTLIAAIERAGYGAAVTTAGASASVDTQSDRDALRMVIFASVLTAPLVLQMAPMLWSAGHIEWLPRWAQLLLAAPVQFWAGWRFLRGAWAAISRLSANMDVLVALGTLSAFLLSTYITVREWLDGSAAHQHVYFESAAVVVTLVLFGKWLEARARSRTNSAVKALIRLQPQTAHVEEQGTTADVPIHSIAPGATLVVRAGESFPVDGVISAGQANIDESMLSGESVPVAKRPGDRVFAGTLNLDGLLRCRATGVGADTAIARVIRMVESAQASKAPVQHLVDRIAEYFVPAVLIIALLTLAGWIVAGAPLENAIVNACAVLVISCPCALGLATPTALIVGMGRAAQRGVLIRDATALEAAQAIRYLVVDKTGTLTEGRPSITDIQTIGGIDTTEAIRLAASLGEGSDHPLSRALVRHAAGLHIERDPVEAFEAVAGQGVHGRIRRGAGEPERYWLGSPAYLTALGQTIDTDALQRAWGNGRSAIGLADASRVLAIFAATDALRPSSPEAVERLKRAGVEVMILSGDDSNTVHAAAVAAGIERFHGNVTPEQKAAQVATLKETGALVAMAGDGVNDAPALATADVGFAIGAGSAVALETAGVTLLRSDLGGVADAIEISRATMRKLRQNLAFAFGYNVLAIPIAAAGWLDPAVAGAAMALSSVSVVVNSLALSQWRPRTLQRRFRPRLRRRNSTIGA